ncbi:MAG: fasciclin domain-containing protein [Actinobacteria bacterium]|nr:fasciclin domain-containing protein [Actinomycetota bacterium]
MNENSSNKGLIWAVVAILVVAIGAFLFFANTNEDEEETTDEATTSEQVAEPEAAEPAQNIVQVASSDPQFSTLVAAVEAAGLVETLSGEGPFTVFAPTDQAFADALEALDITAEELLASENLANILTYHVVEGGVFAADVVELDGQDVETVNGQTVSIRVEDGVVYVNDAMVTVTDIETSNGVIHVIDAVLLPEEE